MDTMGDEGWRMEGLRTARKKDSPAKLVRALERETDVERRMFLPLQTLDGLNDVRGNSAPA